MEVKARTRDTFLDGLNGQHHERAMQVLLVVVLAHWAEHVAQAWQIYAMGMAPAHAGGVLGIWFPVLVNSEWLHYGYAIVMLAGIFLLRFGMSGKALLWWDIALWIQVWHHFEHLLLFSQAVMGANLFGSPVPTSLLQLVVPRVELHLFYNALVFVPMLVGMWYHLVPPDGKPHMTCSCALKWATNEGESASTADMA